MENKIIIIILENNFIEVFSCIFIKKLIVIILKGVINVFVYLYFKMNRVLSVDGILFFEFRVLGIC